MSDDCVLQFLHSEIVNYVLEQNEKKDGKVTKQKSKQNPNFPLISI